MSSAGMGSVMWPESVEEQLQFRKVSRNSVNILPLKGFKKRSVPRSIGNSKAVFIGINYFGMPSELRGCVYDAKNVKQLLQNAYGFPNNPKNVKVLTDEPQNVNTVNFPTADNIRTAIKWLVSESAPGDSLFLHYSGHGGLKYDSSMLKGANLHLLCLDGNEMTGFDQTVYPVDYAKVGPIVDDVSPTTHTQELFDILVSPLPADVRLTAIFDACHSGTVLDLRYLYDLSKTDKPIDSWIPTRKAQCMRGFGNFFSCKTSSAAVEPERSSKGNVIMISGCRDDQLSTDVCNGIECFGALSTLLVNSLRANPNQSYKLLMREVIKAMDKGRFNQIPCISSNRIINLDAKFSL